MRPASLVLLIIGVGLLLGAALVASFKIPCRVRPPYDLTDTQFIRVHCNVWGQPLRATQWSRVQDANGKKTGWITEEGPYPNEGPHPNGVRQPYPNGVRQGKWRRVVHDEGKPDVESDIWYLDGREVSAAEWEQRQAEK